MGFIEDTLNNLLKDLSSSIRKFTAFVFLVFAVGVVVGINVVSKGEPQMVMFAYVAPLILAVASYFFAEVAIAFFVLFLVILILL